MINNSKIIKNYYALLMLLVTSMSFAQDFDDDVEDNPPVSPIDKYLVLALIFGLLFAFYKIKKNVREKFLF